MDLSIKDLLSTLKPNFKSSDITLLEMVLLSREEKIRREKEEVETDLKLEKSKSKQLEEKISVLENDYKSVCENEKKAQKRFTSVSNMVSEIMIEKMAIKGENKKMEKDKMAEDENRKLEKENEILKKRFLDWEIRVGQLEEEASKLSRAESDLSAKLKGKKEGAANASAVVVDSTSHSVVEQSGGLHLKSNGNLANKEHGTAGPSCTTSKSKLVANSKEKKVSACKHGSEVRKQTAAGGECYPSASRHNKVKRARKLVLISESEDEDDIDNIPISRIQNKKF